MRVNDRRHCVCRVVKTIDEFKSESDKQRHPQKNIGQPNNGPSANFVDVAHQAITGDQQTGDEQAKKNDSGD